MMLKMLIRKIMTRMMTFKKMMRIKRKKILINRLSI
jgi:hypothetical protein